MEATLSINGIQQIAQHARDLDEAVAFYRDVLGLKFIARFDPPGLAFFDVAGTRILLEQPAQPALLYFRVSSIQTGYQALKAHGVKLEGEPQLIFRDETGQFGEAAEEEWMAFFRDPSDNLLALASRERR